MFFTGIDWANAKHDTVVIDENGKKLVQIRVDHTAEGLAKLNRFLEQIVGQGKQEEMACIIETTHGLLIASLLEAGWPIYPVNPRTVDRRRGASGAKTDAIDAYLLAKYGRSEFAELRRLWPDSPIITELKSLCRDQDALIQMQTRLVNQLTACRKRYYPVALHLFSKLHQRSTLIFLQTSPTPARAMAASREQIAATLKQAGHTNPEKGASTIFEQLQQPHLSANEISIRTKSRLMLALVAQLRPLLSDIAAYDEEIQRLFLSHANSEIFLSLPRAGKRLAPRLLAEIGDDAERYRDAASLQALAGTSPVLFQSGTYHKAHRRQGCVKPLRNALYQFAWQSTQSEEWARGYYDRKRAEGKSHTVAVRALSNVWARILFALCKTSQPYQTKTFEAAQRQHAKRAA